MMWGRWLVICLPVVAACSQQPKQDDNICSTPGAMTPYDWPTCVHRWSYRLAKGPGENREVAEAVVTACEEAMANEVSAAAAAGAAAGPPPPGTRTVHDEAKARALFFVIQARAGHCDAP